MKTALLNLFVIGLSIGLVSCEKFWPRPLPGGPDGSGPDRGEINCQRGDDVRFQSIEEAGYWEEEENMVIRDQSTFERVFKAIHSREVRNDEVRVPTIDFDKRMVVAVFFGEKATGGFGININSIKRQGRELFVNVHKKSPGERCMVTQAFTYPLQLVEVEKSAEVHFCEEHEYYNCR